MIKSVTIKRNGKTMKMVYHPTDPSRKYIETSYYEESITGKRQMYRYTCIELTDEDFREIYQFLGQF